jgi:hypothetical protein
MLTFHAQIEIPKCWKELITVDFPLNLHGVTSEKHLTGIDDPRPHYDDWRVINGRFVNGHHVHVSIASGQSNYYGWLSLTDGDGCSVYEAELESFDDLNVEVDGTAYAVEVEWV